MRQTTSTIATLTLLMAATAAFTGCEDRSRNGVPVNSTAPNTSNTMPSTTTSPSTTTPAPRAADNTGRNERDRNTANPTPMDQSETEADRKITAQIRTAIMQEKGLSINAQNVKIITRDGAVVLRGPVNTQAEKDSIEAKAKSIAGVSRVTNDLEVITPR